MIGSSGRRRNSAVPRRASPAGAVRPADPGSDGEGLPEDASPAHLKAHLDYVTRNGSLRMEHSDGYEMEGREAVRHLCDDWLPANAIYGKPGPNASQSVSVVLSMAPGTDPDRVQDAARAWARANLGNHEWIMVRHDDQEHPHVHVTVRAVGRDGPWPALARSSYRPGAKTSRASCGRAASRPKRPRDKPEATPANGLLIRSTVCSSAVSNRVSSRSQRPAIAARALAPGLCGAAAGRHPRGLPGACRRAAKRGCRRSAARPRYRALCIRHSGCTRPARRADARAAKCAGATETVRVAYKGGIHG